MKFIFSLILTIIVAVLAIQNSDVVTIQALGYKVAISQALVILFSVVVGAIIAFSIGLIKQLGMNKQLKERAKTIKQLEYELSTAKTQLATYEKIPSPVSTATATTTSNLQEQPLQEVDEP